MTSRALLVSLAIGVAGWLLLRGDDPAPDAPAGPADPATRNSSRTTASARPSDGDPDARERMASVMRLRLERALEAPEELPMPETVQSRLEAETSFEVVMEKLEELAEKGDSLPRRRRARIYRHANDSFAALSNYLDPNSARDRAILEDGYTRMKAMLAEVGAEPNL